MVHEELLKQLNQYLAQNYIHETPLASLFASKAAMHAEPMSMAMPAPMRSAIPVDKKDACEGAVCEVVQEDDLSDFIDDSYEENGVAKQLNLYMYERDITTAMIYERCFVDRRLISKITGNDSYHPSKNTMLALCIGLQLNLPESEHFLQLAGYSFTNTSKYDLIFQFMISRGIYDLDTINEMLYAHKQPCMGA